MSTTSDLTISQVAEIMRCHRLTLINWERRGLIHPKRDLNGYRRYTQADVDKLKELFELRRAD
jgi:DNA-binding transcriptional MerR regulator